jgi:hypothetical protein
MVLYYELFRHLFLHLCSVCEITNAVFIIIQSYFFIKITSVQKLRLLLSGVMSTYIFRIFTLQISHVGNNKSHRTHSGKFVPSVFPYLRRSAP